ncbi:Por secretion system C-terminal sorting domain-containing protein [Flavobacterium akiainvivens]|nr:Por secretion system C-terminal sorting domain-containing protein [Flavobacterium akiainvivens]
MLSMGFSAFAVDVPPGTNNLQAAINSAAPGETLNLQAGTYFVSSTITLNKQITLQGVGMGTIIQKTNGAAADVAAIVIPNGVNGCTLKDFRLLGQDQGGPGIMVFSNSNSLINVNVSDCGNNSANGPGSWRAGILLEGAEDNVLTDVKSHHNSWVGISQHSSPGTTITGADCFLNHGEGLTIDLGSHNCVVTNSLFNENNVSTRGVGGIGIDDVNNATIQYCTINDTHNLHGITFQNNVGGEDGCVITNNTINNSSQNGIRIRNCTYAVTNTTIGQNSYTGNGSADVYWECDEPTAFLGQQEMQVLKIYPNPAVDVVSVDFGQAAINGFELLSITGQQVLTIDSEKLAGNTIDISGISAGVYIYKVSHNHGTTTGRLVIK